MKTFNLVTIILIVILFSCSAIVETDSEKVEFGIFEMVKSNEIPEYIMDSIKAKNV